MQEDRSATCVHRLAEMFLLQLSIRQEFLGVLLKQKKKAAFITTSGNTRGSFRNLAGCFYIHCPIMMTQAIFVLGICVSLMALQV